MSDEDLKGFEFKDMGLKALIAAMKTTPKVKIGVLGGKSARRPEASIEGTPKQPLTNAEVGQIAEFGTEHTPVRSWLRMPLIKHLQSYMDKAGAFKKEVVIKILETRSLTPFMGKVGLTGERVIADGFDSGGFGEWPESDMRYKKNHQTLVETQQLRNSVTSEVEE